MSSGHVAIGRVAVVPQASPERLHRDLAAWSVSTTTRVVRVVVDGASQGEVAAELGLAAAAARKGYQRPLRRARGTVSEAA